MINLKTLITQDVSLLEKFQSLDKKLFESVEAAKNYLSEKNIKNITVTETSNGLAVRRLLLG